MSFTRLLVFCSLLCVSIALAQPAPDGGTAPPDGGSIAVPDASSADAGTAAPHGDGGVLGIDGGSLPDAQPGGSTQTPAAPPVADGGAAPPFGPAAPRTEGASAYAPSSQPDVVVTAARTQEEIGRAPQSVGVVTQTEIERRQPKSTFHMMLEEPGVWLTQANETFRFPILRGRQGDDLVYLRDGTRMISFQALDFPVGLVDRIEYIRGPGSVQYGSNSLGGVVNVITKRVEIFPDAPRFGGEVYARYGGVNNETTDYLNLWVASKYVNAMVGATFQRIGDYTSPTFGRIDYAGGFQTYNIYGELGFRPKRGHDLRVSYVLMRKSDQVFYGQSKINPSGIPNNVLEYENRDMVKLEYRARDLAPGLSEIWAFAYFQTNDRLAHITTETPASVMPGSISRTDIGVKQWYFGASVQGTSRFKLLIPVRLVYGAEFRLEDIAQPRELVTTDKGSGAETKRTLAGAIPRSRYDVFGAFLLADLQLFSRLQLQGGVRFETTGFSSSPDPIDALPPFTVDDLSVQKRWYSVVGSVGPVLAITRNLSLAGNIGTGFRVPTPFELVLTQVQGNANGVSTIPSTTLEPVESITYELGPRWASRYVKAAVIGYYTSLKNLIGFVNTPITIDIPGVGVVATRRNENSLSGFIAGLEAFAEVRLPFFPQLAVFSNLTYTYGRDDTRDVPLRGIPPLNGIAGLRWQSPQRGLWGEGVVHWAARKTDTAPEEKVDQAFARDPGLGSPNMTTNPPLEDDFSIPGYAVLYLRGGARLWSCADRSIDLMIAVNNVTNTSYRPAFAAIREAPGIGADFAIKGSF